MASPTWWTWVWVNFGNWWWTGRPGMLQFMRSQGVRHDWATELNLNWYQIYTFVCIHMHKHMCIYRYIFKYIYIHIYIYIYTHIHTPIGHFGYVYIFYCINIQLFPLHWLFYIWQCICFNVTLSISTFPSLIVSTSLFFMSPYSFL